MNTVEPIRDLETIKKVRVILSKQSTRDELLFILGINIGLRISDLLNLKVEDLMKPDKMVKEHITIKEKKTSKTKKFYIVPVVTELLKKHIKINNLELNDYIFFSKKSSRNEKPMSRMQAWRILNDAFETIGLVERGMDDKIIEGEYGTHTLRKTFGYFSYKNGTPLILLMDIFNHSSEAMTLKYIGITEEQKKGVYEKVSLG